MAQGTSFITPGRVTQLSELRSGCSGSPSLLLHAVQVLRKPTRRRVRSTLSCDGGSYGGFDGGLARDRAVVSHNLHHPRAVTTRATFGVIFEFIPCPRCDIAYRNRRAGE